MKTEKYKQLLQNLSIFSISYVLSKLILCLMLPLYTRTLSQAEYGNAELVTNIIQILIPVCTLAIHSAVFRYSMDTEYRYQDVLKSGLPVMLLSGIFFFIFSYFLKFIYFLSDYSIFCFFISFLSAIRSYFSLYTKACGKSIVFSVDAIFYNFLLFIFNVIMLAFLKNGLSGYFLSIIFANIASIIFLFFLGGIYRDVFGGKYNFKLLKMMLKYSFPVVFTDIAWGLISTTDKYMITDRLSDSANGIYSAASKFSFVVSLVSGTFTEAWTISAIKNYGKDDEREFYGNVFFILHTMLTGILLVLFAMNNLFVPFFLGDEFVDASKYTPLLLIASYLTGYSLYYSALFSAIKKMKGVMISVLLGVSTNILLNLLLIPKMSIYGACIATIVSSAIICIYRMIIIRKIMIIDDEILKWIISIILVGIVMLASMVGFYEIIFSIICALVLLILYRDRIRRVLKFAFNLIK